MTVRSKIIRIGNSKGLRLSTSIIDASGIHGDVTVEARSGEIVIQKAHDRRKDWDARFQDMASHRDDELLNSATPLSDWDDSEWEWK